MLRRCMNGIIFPLFILAGLALIAPAQAAFPDKNIRIIVPFKAGGGSDVSARLFAKYWEKQLPVKVVVTNIDGGSGRIGEMETMKAAPDGYTLLWQHHQMYAANICGFSDYSWEAFTPVFTAVTSPFALVVHKGIPDATVTALMETARTKPGTLTWAFTPLANTQFYYLDIISKAGIAQDGFRPISNLPGDANRVLAMLQGNIDVTVNTISSVMPYFQSGDLRLLALTGNKNLPSLPDVKTLEQLGIPSTLGQTDYVVWEPAGMPEEINEILSDSAQKALQDLELLKEAETLGIVANFYAGKELRERVKAEYDLMRALAQQFGILKQ